MPAKQPLGAQMVVRLPKPMYEQLRAIAEREERSLAQIARMAIREYLAKGDRG